MTVSREGLCQKCESSVKARVVQAMRVLNENLALMKRARDVDTRLARSQDAIKQLRDIVPYFEKGLVALKPSPQEWVARIYVAERKIVQDHIEGLLHAVGEAEIAHTSRTEQLNEIIEAIEKYRVHLGEGNAMLLRKRVEMKLSHHLLDSAEKDTSSGNRDRALDQYIEALDMMRTDRAHDPDQQRRIENIKTRIRDLGGTIPKRWDEAERIDRMVD